jgi:hypothetical protein
MIRYRIIYLIRTLTLAVAMASLASIAQGASDTPAVEEIVNRANLVSYFQGRDGRARVAMIITDNQDRTRRREVTILRRDGPDTDALDEGAYLGEQQYYVYFRRPADVSQMVLLVWKYQGRDDDRWMYLPALDLVKRIAASDKRTSFVGSDFFYEDISGRNIDADSHELIDTTDNYYVVRNKPKDPQAVEFAYYDVYIHKQTFLPISTEYIDESGNAYRRYTALAVEDVQGYPTVVKARMEDLRSGSTTELTYSGVGYDLDLPEEIFTERYLRRAPMEYLR